MTMDSVLVLLHDNTLDRTTNSSGSISAKLWRDLDTVRLKDPAGSITPYSIPLFNDVLEWTKLKGAVLTVDVKRGVPFERVIQAIEKYGLENRAAVITYNYNDALKVHQINPRIVISANMRNLEEVERLVAGGIPPDKLLAFVGTREPLPELYDRLKSLQIPAILGTLGNLDNMAKARGSQVYQEFIQRGAGILATDRPFEAFEAIRN
jgi:glycerophosphoryl diester phosphodiesterase